MADGNPKSPFQYHDGIARVSAGAAADHGNGNSPDVAKVSEILRARSFAKLRNQSNGDLEG